MSDPRALLTRIGDLLRLRPDFRTRYEAAKTVVRIFRKPAFYEITQRCNLKCEGCYYFEGGLNHPVEEEQSLAAWDEFFAAEARRNVSMAYFVGAEPSIEQERMVAAARYFPYGNIGTNGTIRIDPVVPYRVAVSIWAGDDDTDRKLRGASAFRKAFRNYRGDPRVLVYYTLTRWNLGSARTIAEMCRDNGVPLTFNLYSPNTTFLAKLRSGEHNDDEFFRVSRPGDAPLFSDDDLIEVNRLIASLMEEFPQTVVYSKAYNDWSTRPGPLHEIDAAGIATRCGSRITSSLKYYASNLEPIEIKCCTPDLDCSQCRIMSGGWSTKLQPTSHDLTDENAFDAWLEIIAAIGRIFVYDHQAHTAEVPMPLSNPVAAE